ncbi:cyclic nucleotide-gated ion channel 18 isoform X2 [Ricinus communis]|uniref:cyclic nucleotide-gated ion channel 18 isoform X2 n=1 Tax=Ricinus communis TaxID=3988 RepID=UPI00201B1672|nr:cyclic nucleotide-gated ion channel 18 isoform X2 [Ricinus communis]
MNRFIPNPNSKLRHFRRLHHHLTSPSLASSATSLSDANPLHILWHYQILDPDSDIVTYWNYVFLITSIVALFVDPLFFFLPYADADGVCLTNDASLAVLITYFRSFADLFFLLHIIMKFRTAFVAPNSRVFGRGELVMDAKEIARRYLRSDFVIDLAAALPLPQVVIWVVIPAARNGRADHANNTLSLIVLIQYIPRLFVIFPLHQRIVKSTGFIAKTAWAGAAYNLLLYMLASHTLGSSWYLLSLGRQFYCWKSECLKENKAGVIGCIESFLDCNSLGQFERQYWRNVTHVRTNCDPYNNNITFEFGIFAGAFTNDVATAPFVQKYLYCLWWGLRNLSSYAQTLETSTFLGENIFCIVTCIIGLVLSAQLIGNMQTNLQSMTVRVEEWRIKRRDTEEWMRHRQLPPDLQERVRRFVQYKWLATRGVHEESILRSLPLDLRREIQRHLCLALVRRVPFFSQMDDQLLDAICERLVSSLSTEGTYIFSEGDPVNEMLFIIRGTLESSTTNGGRSGFFNSITLRPGDFCGEELLTWALMPNSSAHLPASTRTVKALSEVEAFALQAEDLIFVAQQFKRLQSKKLQHAFRYYSHQWRTWGAILIQSVWRRYQKRKMARELASRERLSYIQIPEDGYYSSNELAEGDYEDEHGESLSMENANNAQHLGATILASKFAANTRRGINQRLVDSASSSVKVPKLFKPVEPDFFADHV